ncbi:hypothetical protein [Halorarius halobius]|uniref:hypothetical protein n=1 Tax=Halorarius halobius TaxID=2962671 RepID=UPI003D9C8604
MGADLAAVCREAATIAVREHVQAQTEGVAAAVEDIVLTQAYFKTALEEIRPENANLAEEADEL